MNKTEHIYLTFGARRSKWIKYFNCQAFGFGTLAHARHCDPNHWFEKMNLFEIMIKFYYHLMLVIYLAN